MRRFAVVVPIGALAAWIAAAQPLLGQTAPQPRGTCVEPTLADLPRKADGSPGHIEKLSIVYLPFAIASSAAYRAEAPNNTDDDVYSLASIDPAHWREMPLSPGGSSGIGARTYIRDTPEQTDIIIAYRGTQSWVDVKGWVANFSWATRWVNSNDQYDAASDYFQQVRQHSLDNSPGKSVSFYVTGHSLGGGLAQHVARKFNCVMAVVFDSSPVTNEYTRPVRRADAPIVHIWEEGDIVGTTAAVLKYVLGDYNTKTYQGYGIRLITKGEATHPMDKFAISMARNGICCKQRNKWTYLKDKVDRTDCEAADDNMGQALAKSLYCDHYMQQSSLKIKYPNGDDVCDFDHRPTDYDCLH